MRDSDVFGRPSQVETPWYAEDAEDNDDMWATAEQDIPWMLDFCEQVWAQSDATIAALDLDAPGQVPWWREGEVTLHLILVHVIAEYARHAGHLDIARELLDGQIGWKQESPVLPDWESRRWAEYVDRLKELVIVSGFNVYPVELSAHGIVQGGLLVLLEPLAPNHARSGGGVLSATTHPALVILRGVQERAVEACPEAFHGVHRSQEVPAVADLLVGVKAE